MRFIKSLEYAGRRLLARLLAAVLGVSTKYVEVPNNPKVLVIRLDERLGNLLLLTPLLYSLRARLPNCTLDVLVQQRGAALLAEQPPINTVLSFHKRALFSYKGPFGTLWAMRKRRYDICIDAANPTFPSLTQAFLTRMSGAKHTIGPKTATFGYLYSAPVPMPAQDANTSWHEIDLRLQLLQPFPGTLLQRTPSWSLSRADHQIAAWLVRQGPHDWGVINVGARLPNKRLAAADYVLLAELMVAAGLKPLITWGPCEMALAKQTAQLCPQAVLAPTTDTLQLASLFHQAHLVVSCDTGPMHLAVALQVPTCGIFVSTEPKRYGYTEPPHIYFDARHGGFAKCIPELQAWMSRTISHANMTV